MKNNSIVSPLLWFGLRVYVDYCGKRSSRALRLEGVYAFVYRINGIRYRILDGLLPNRRRAIAQRNHAIFKLTQPVYDRASNNSPNKLVSLPTAWQFENDLVNLRVGLFIPSFLRGQGGAEKVAGQLANVLSQVGLKVDLFCRESNGSMPTYSVGKEIQIRNFDEQDDEAVKQFRGEHYDVLIFFGMSHFYRRIPEIAKVLDTPYIIQECTNPVYMMEILHKLTDAHSIEDAYWLRQAVFAHASGIRLTSQRFWSSIKGNSQPFTYAFYNAFTLPENWSYEINRQPAKKLICVGAFKNENKNGMAALSAFCHFSKHREDWSLAIYGDNNYTETIAQELKIHINATVSNEGIIQNTYAIYGDAHALIIPSYKEGLPNVIVEAFSFGVPCIGYSDCEAVAHLIIHGENGLLVDRNDSKGLEYALEEIANSEYRKKLSEGAKRFAIEHFDFDVWRKNWLQLIYNAANGLSNQGQKQKPEAFDQNTERALLWSQLLETFRAIA